MIRTKTELGKRKLPDPVKIFEDKSLLILNKPAGWIVNNSETTAKQPVVEKWLEKKHYPLSNRKDYRSGIVHRIDKATSGILIVAKTKRAFKNIQAQFKKRIVKKKYTALLRGKLVPQEGEVNVPMGRLPWNRKRFGILIGGKNSKTKYKVLKYLKKGDDFFSLAEFYPETGRTHQIRVHAKYLGHPIISDEFYGGRKMSRKDKEWCGRLFLHASEISFIHPRKHSLVSFKVKLPRYLKVCLSKLQEVEE